MDRAGESLTGQRSRWGPASRCVYGCVMCPPTCVGFAIPALCGMLGRRCLASCGVLASAPEGIGAQSPSIFFEGCGFAFSFGLGVVKHLQETYVIDDRLSIYSISAGTLAALALALDIDPVEVLANNLETYLRIFFESTPCYGTFGALDGLAAALEVFLPPDSHATCSGRVNIVVSNWPCLGFRVVNQFASRAALIETVLASCSFPFFAWRPRCSSCPCKFDAGFQSMVTPVDVAVDVTVRAMPFCKPCIAPALARDLKPVADPAARSIGHLHAFDSSLIPEGDAVWNGGRPPDIDRVRDLIMAARAQAAASPLIRRAFDAKLVKRNEPVVVVVDLPQVEPAIPR